MRIFAERRTSSLAMQNRRKKEVVIKFVESLTQDGIKITLHEKPLLKSALNLRLETVDGRY